MILHALALTALVQSPGQEPPKKDEHAPIVVPLAGHADDPHQQMLELIGKVEQRLRQIDKLLAEAGAATRSAELVRRSQDEGRKVVEEIDKILELADHPHPAGAS